MLSAAATVQITDIDDNGFSVNISWRRIFRSAARAGSDAASAIARAYQNFSNMCRYSVVEAALWFLLSVLSALNR